MSKVVSISHQKEEVQSHCREVNKDRTWYRPRKLPPLSGNITFSHNSTSIFFERQDNISVIPAGMYIERLLQAHESE